MESSILTSTKKILGITKDYTAFDFDIITHINAAFSTLNQIGIGPEDGFMIEDKNSFWEEYEVPNNQLNLVKTYIFLKVKFIFDPPGTSFVLESIENQIKEFEWRLKTMREEELWIQSTT